MKRFYKMVVYVVTIGNMEGIFYDIFFDDFMSYGFGKVSMIGMDSGFINVLV